MNYVLSEQRIHAARLAAGLLQGQPDEMTGHTSQYISHSEFSSAKISLNVLVKTVFYDSDPAKVYVMPAAASAVKKSIRIRKLQRMD